MSNTNEGELGEFFDLFRYWIKIQEKQLDYIHDINKNINGICKSLEDFCVTTIRGD